jgi:hypothetical protein
MRSVNVKAVNLREGDILQGCRIKAVHRFFRRNRAKTTERLANYGVLVIVPDPQGYNLLTKKFVGHQRVTVRRPKYNMARS